MDKRTSEPNEHDVHFVHVNLSCKRESPESPDPVSLLTFNHWLSSSHSPYPSVRVTVVRETRQVCFSKTAVLMASRSRVEDVVFAVQRAKKKISSLQEELSSRSEIDCSLSVPEFVEIRFSLAVVYMRQHFSLIVV